MRPTLASLLCFVSATVLIVGSAHRSTDGDRGEVASPRAVAGDSHIAVTKPSRAVRLSGARAGRIARVMVEPGAMVEQGQLLFELDNEVERLEYERLRLSASGRATIALATARLEKAKAEAKRVAELTDQDITSGAREDEVVANLRIAEAELAKALEMQAILALQRDQALARFELLRGRSPFDGRVEQLLHDVGESVDHLEPVLDLVALHPLHVEFPCPVDQRDEWQPGAVAEVVSEGAEPTSRAVVVFCGRQTEVASQTVTVRLELQNADGRWLAGRRVSVRRIESDKGK